MRTRDYNSRFKAAQSPSGGFYVRPDKQADVASAPAPRQSQRELVDATMREALGKRAKVTPGGGEMTTVPVDVLRQALEALVPHEDAREAYQATYGSRALEALVGDLDDFHRGVTNDPYASLAHLLRTNKKPKTGKETCG